jgi:predicted regulator of Ras-like GTPase activity (Roadblock/LC7/MglB family)
MLREDKLMNTLNHSVNHREPSTAFIQAVKVPISELLLEVTGVQSVLLATTDGFEVATAAYKKDFDNAKLAAVSSSILAMVQAFVGEIRLQGCQSMILDAQNGKAFIYAVPCKNHPMVMVVLAQSNVLIGQLQHAMRECSSRLQKIDQRL